MINYITRSSATILSVTVVLAFLMVLNYSSAQWQSAPSNPPNNNVAAPINVGAQNQVKDGRIGADQFTAFDRMRSNLYCDQAGGNCFAPADAGSSISAPPVCSGDDALQWNGSSWVCAAGALAASCYLDLQTEETCSAQSWSVFSGCSAGYEYVGVVSTGATCGENGYVSRHNCAKVVCS